MTIHRVIIQIRRPTETDRGQVSEGYYTITDGVLTMTRPDGEPVAEGQFTHILKPGDSPVAIAGILTRRARRYLLGISEESEAFGRRLEYTSTGVA